MRIALPFVILLAGCPTPADEPGDEPGDAAAWPVWEAADAFEVEPNDPTPQDLGTIAPNYSVAGRSGACGGDGGWADADIDRLAFTFADDAFVRIRLRAEGADLDLEVYDPDGDVLGIEDGTGTDDEVLDVALEAGATYSARIRCWLGNDDRWILAFADRG